MTIDRSRSARSVERMARRYEAAYEQIRQDVRASDQVTPDETGWRVGGQEARLHAFANATPTIPQGVDHGVPTVLVDGGTENFNGPVDELINSGLLHRVLAGTEITYSNLMIESWVRVLKHQWLYLNTLDTVRAVEKPVAFYVQEHNSRLPHSAFRGQTPDEMYFKTGDGIPEELEGARQKARQARAETNRKRDCEACDITTDSARTRVSPMCC